MKIFFVYDFLLEIQSELEELKIKKVYLFDPPSTTKLSNGSESETSSFGTVQLHEQLKTCSIQPPKPIPYNAKRIYS